MVCQILIGLLEALLKTSQDFFLDDYNQDHEGEKNS